MPRCLTLDLGLRVAHEVNGATLPGCAERVPDRLSAMQRARLNVFPATWAQDPACNAARDGIW